MGALASSHPLHGLMIRDDVGLRQPKEFQELMKALERHEDCVIDLVTQFDVVEGGDVCVWAIGGAFKHGRQWP